MCHTHDGICVLRGIIAIVKIFCLVYFFHIYVDIYVTIPI